MRTTAILILLLAGCSYRESAIGAANIREASAALAKARPDDALTQQVCQASGVQAEAIRARLDTEAVPSVPESAWEAPESALSGSVAQAAKIDEEAREASWWDALIGVAKKVGAGLLDSVWPGATVAVSAAAAWLARRRKKAQRALEVAVEYGTKATEMVKDVAPEVYVDYVKPFKQKAEALNRRLGTQREVSELVATNKAEYHSGE